MIDRIIRECVRRILQNYERNAPYLSGWDVSRNEVQALMRFELRLEDGTRHSFMISESVIRQIIGGPGHANLQPEYLLQRQFAIAYEDHLMELDLRDARVEFDNVRRNSTNPYEIEDAYRRYQEIRHRIESHYRDRQGEVSALAQGVGRPIRVWRDPPNRWADSGVPIRDPAIETITPQQLARMPFAERERYLPAVRRPGRIDPLARERLEAALQEDNAKRDAVRKRGIELLKQHLSPDQLAQYEKHKYFDVVGSKTGRKYRIHHGRSSNVFRLSKTNIPECGYCFLTEGGLCEGDVMLAQKLALECDEPAALKVANQF